MNLTGLYYGLLFIGFCLVFIPPVVIISQHRILQKEDFAAQIFTPQIIGLILLIIGHWGTMREYTNPTAWYIIITFTAAGALLNSIVAAFQSIILVRWQAD